MKTLPVTIAEQLSLLEAPVTVVLEKGSIKGAMREAAMPDAKIAPSRDLWQLEPKKLKVVADLNPRVRTPDYLAHIRKLADSMLEEGFYQDKPLAGYVMKEGGKNVVYIYEGGSRLEAALLAISEGAKFVEVPVSVSQEGMNMEDILVAMVKGNEGRPLTSYEKAVICKRLARCNWKPSQIAKRLGMAASMVQGLLALMEAPFEIREMVATELVSATMAIELLDKHGAVVALEKLLAAQDAAAEVGNTRITQRFVPGAKFARAVKKAGPVMFDTLTVIQSDPGFAGLSEETRTTLEKLIGDLKAVKDKTDTATTSDAAQEAIKDTSESAQAEQPECVEA